MRPSRPLSIVAGVSAMALATLVVASPASAATLPDGQKITVVHLIQAEVPPTGSQTYQVSPADAASTAVGSVQLPDDVQAIDVNDEGIGYATIRERIDEGAFPVLAAYNANTGEYSALVTITPVDPAISLSTCDGLDLQPNGEILVACAFTPDGVLDNYIGVVTPEGAFTPFVTNGAEDLYWTALAFNAVTNELWAFAEIDGGSFAYLVDRAAGTLALPIYLDEVVFGADFDRDGQLFVTSRDSQGTGPSVLATADLATGIVSFIGPFTNAGANLRPVLAITVWGNKPALADTGVDVMPVALGSALLLLAGAAFIATARMQRRRA